jgi:eukaryotic-like serine/threonine-protein kinase
VPSQLDQLIGQTLNGRYQVQRMIGAGGMGAVLEGVQLQTDRPVAIKVLNPDLAGNPELVARFRREAKAACKLRDPHTVTTHDFDQTKEGALYLVMELIRGRTLDAELAAVGALPPVRALALVDQVCEALVEAHGAGIVHRDLKPGNILIEDRPGRPDFVKVVDFGIAKIMEDGPGEPTAKLTADGQIIGTLLYLSPEQIEGGAIDHRADIYALGVILWELLAGRCPFDGTPVQVIAAHVHKPPPPPSSATAGLSPELDALVLSCLAKAPEERFQSVAALRGAIAACIGPATATTAAQAPTVVPPRQARSPIRVPAAPQREPRSLTLWITAGVVGLLVIAALVAIIHRVVQDPASVPPPLTARATSPPGPIRPTPAQPPAVRPAVTSAGTPVLVARASAGLTRLIPGRVELAALIRPRRLLRLPGFERMLQPLLTAKLREGLGHLDTAPAQLDSVLLAAPRLSATAWAGGKDDPELVIALTEVRPDGILRWFKAKEQAREHQIEGRLVYSAKGVSMTAYDARTLLGGHTWVLRKAIQTGASAAPGGARGDAHVVQQIRRFDPLGLLVLRPPALAQPKLRRGLGLQADSSINEVTLRLTGGAAGLTLQMLVRVDRPQTADHLLAWFGLLKRNPDKAPPRLSRLLQRVRARRLGASVEATLRARPDEVALAVRDLKGRPGGAGSK